MKASYEFVMLNLLVAFSLGSRVNTLPGSPKQSIHQVKLTIKTMPNYSCRLVEINFFNSVLFLSKLTSNHVRSNTARKWEFK